MVSKPAITKVIQHHLVAIMVKASPGGINSGILVIQNAKLPKNKQTNKQTTKQNKTKKKTVTSTVKKECQDACLIITPPEW